LRFRRLARLIHWAATGSKEEAKFERRNSLPANKMLFMALLSKLIFGFSVWSKPVVVIIIERGFDANILGLILIFCLSGGLMKSK
jgi:hypothetical protein